jgi:hypothetical protein
VWNVTCLSNLSSVGYLSCPSYPPWLAILMCGEFWNSKRHENIFNKNALSVFLHRLVGRVLCFNVNQNYFVLQTFTQNFVEIKYPNA